MLLALAQHVSHTRHVHKAGEIHLTRDAAYCQKEMRIFGGGNGFLEAEFRRAGVLAGRKYDGIGMIFHQHRDTREHRTKHAAEFLVAKFVPVIWIRADFAS